MPSLRRTADLVFARARVAVFVDGCFWHGCPVHGTRPATNVVYWQLKLDRTAARDLETNQALADHDWLALRFWEHDDPEVVADVVEAEVRRRARR